MNEERQRQFAATHCRFADEGFPAAYVLDALDGTDLAQFRAHLPTCPICTAEVATLGATAAQFPLLIDETAPESQPTPALRQRLLDSVAAERPAAAAPPAPISFPAARRWAQPFAVAAVLLLALSLSLLAWNLNVQGDLRAARSERDQAVATIALTQQQLQQAQRERDQAQAALAATRFQLAATAGQVASGTITYLPAQQQAVIVVNNLPALASGQVYQLWLITGNNVQPSTVFLTPTTAVQANLTQFQVAAITIEPGPTGSTAPTSTPIVTANLGGQ
ncbi:MAG: anti-sigma factor [Chloroflexia bacterium]